MVAFTVIGWNFRGCLHEKTGAGASFIRTWFFDFVSRLHDDWVISHFVIWRYTLFKDKMYVWFKIANITHALPVPVYRQTDFTPKRVVVSCLHDAVAIFRTGVKFSPRYKNRGELAPGWKSPRCRVNTPLAFLRLSVNIFSVAVNKKS